MPTIYDYKNLNPLQFVAGELLNNNLMLVRLKEAAVPAGAPLAECMECFKQALPAGTSYLLFTETAASLLECPDSQFQNGEPTAFHVAAGAEAVTSPVAGERITPAGQIF